MGKRAKAKFYAVAKGRQPGIYHTWDECQEQVLGYSGASHQNFSTRQEAEQFIQQKQETRQNGYVQDSIFTAPLSENKSIDLPAKNQNASTQYYAVAIGRKPGIYNSWPECQAQVEGLPFKKYKKFETLTDAESFVAQFASKPIVNSLSSKLVKNVPKPIAIAYCDGGCRPNLYKGEDISSYGAVVYDKSGNRIFWISAFLDVGHTLNTAEYSGLIQVLKAGTGLGIKKLKIIMDSELVVRQMIGVYRVSSERLVPFYEKAKRFESNYKEVKFAHTLRAGNKEADSLATKAILNQETEFSKSHDYLNAKDDILEIQNNLRPLINQFPKPKDYNIKHFGSFRCLNCGRAWDSANSWKDVGQRCQNCESEVKPHTLRPMEGARYQNICVGLDHDSERCAK